MPEDPSRNSLLLRFFSNPIVGLIGWLATVLSLILTIYFYKEGKDTRKLIYYVHPIKTVLVRAGQASRLTTDFDGQRVQGDITAAQVALWNQGNLSIKSENILKPIVLYTANNAPILEATIRKRSRDVTGISLDTENVQQGRLVISWNILEGNDGCVVQLIYAGSPEVSLLMDGVVEGQRHIEHLQFAGKIKSADEQVSSNRREDRTGGIFLLGTGVLFLLISVYSIIWRRRRKPKAKRKREEIEELENLDVSTLKPGKFKEIVERYLKREAEELDEIPGLSNRVVNAMLKIGIIPLLVVLGLLYSVFGIFVLFRAHELGPPFGF